MNGVYGMKKKTAAVLLLALLLGGCAAPEKKTPEITSQSAETMLPAETAAERTDEGAALPETTEQPFLVQITENDPSAAYVLVRMPDPVGLLPLPTEGEYTRAIRRTAADGSEAVNVIHLTPEGFRMESANCEGQDCVLEGTVTLENREERILWNMIVCLPHQLSLELLTREEAQNYLTRMYR
jgi:hypothetical protein